MLGAVLCINLIVKLFEQKYVTTLENLFFSANNDDSKHSLHSEKV